MKITQQPQQKEYPYLAVMTLGDPIKQHINYPIEEIVLISLVPKEGENSKPYVQYITGGTQGWFTEKEKNFVALPKGYEITMKQ